MLVPQLPEVASKLQNGGTSALCPVCPVGAELWCHAPEWRAARSALRLRWLHACVGVFRAVTTGVTAQPCCA